MTTGAFDATLIFLDVETTGLYAQTGDSICEIGAVKTARGKALCEFQTLINPGRPVPYGAYRVHKISDDELKDAPAFADVAEDFLKFIANAPVCAYNANFDMSFINSEMARAGYPALANPVIDVLAMARALVASDRHNLKTVAANLNIFSPGGLHRALADCRVTARVFYEMIKDMNEPQIEDLVGRFGFVPSARRR